MSENTPKYQNEYYEDGSIQTEYKYDEQGNVICKIEYGEKGNIEIKCDFYQNEEWKCYYEYDKNGNLVNKSEYNENGRCIYEIKNRYDDDGNIINKHEIKTEYNEDDKKILETHLVDARGIKRKTVRTYDERQMVIRTDEFHYDEQGELRSEFHYDGQGQFISDNNSNTEKHIHTVEDIVDGINPTEEEIEKILKESIEPPKKEDPNKAVED